MLKTICVA